MKHTLSTLLLLGTLALPAYASDEHGHDHAHEEESTHTTIAADMAAASHIETATAGTATIHQTVTLNGRLSFHPDYTARLHARFPGVIRSMRANIGEAVKRGDTLATIESNDSLQTYTLKAPINGTVVQRSGTIGEASEGAPLFVLADTQKLWATLHVFPANSTQLQAGQAVEIADLSGNRTSQAKLTNILPDPDSDTPLALAHISLENNNGTWHAGEAIIARVITHEKHVPVAVKSAAVQQHDGQPVVFVQEGDGYEARPVALGLDDGHYVEVLSGLDAGETYVSQNSFIIRADLEKSDAGHEH